MADVHELDISGHLVKDGGRKETIDPCLIFDFDDIPPSLIRYFETSKSRAAVCEKLILEEPDDFTPPHRHPEDMMNYHLELDEDLMTLNQQVTGESDDEENNTSTDARLPPAPTEAEERFPHNVSVCPNNEDEAWTCEYLESERYLSLEMDEDEASQSLEDEEERDKLKREEWKKEERRRQTERDFQLELGKIMEAEQRHQKEHKLSEKRAQEKLKEQYLLQQEVIRNLQRQLVLERRMREEEQTRMNDEEDKRKRKEQRTKMEEERRVEEEISMREEEQKRNDDEEDKRKREEERTKMEEERRRVEEERRMKDKEDRRRREDQRITKMEEERRRVEEEMSVREEEQKRKKDEEDKRKREEERRRVEEERKMKDEEDKRKREERAKLAEERRAEEERRIKDEEDKRRREEQRRIMMDEERRRVEGERRMKEEEDRRRKEEQITKTEEERVRLEEEMSRKKKEERKMEEMKRIKEEEIKNKEEEMRVARQETRRMEENRKRIELEKKKLEDEMKMMREEESRRIKEEVEEIETEEEEERQKRDEEPKQMGDARRKDEMEREKIKMEEDRWLKPEEGWRKRAEREKQKTETEKLGLLGKGKVAKEFKERMEKMREKKEEEAGDRKQMDGRGCGNVDEEIKTQERKMKEEINRRKREEDEKNEGEEELRQWQKEKMRRQREDRKEEKGAETRQGERDSKAKAPGNKKEEKAGRRKNEEEVEEEAKGERDEKKEINKRAMRSIQQEVREEGAHGTKEKRDPVPAERSAGTAWTPSGPGPSSICLPDHTEQKRMSWMKDCIPWTKLSLENKRKQRGPVRNQRGLQRAADAGSLPALSPQVLLRSTGCRSLQEVITLTLQDLPDCSLSSLAQCPRLRSLSLRCCGLKSLEGVKRLQQLCYIDVQDNYISYVDCENMPNLRVLKLSHNKLTSIHGLGGAENLDVLELSHNSITRIAGLESMKRLQRLLVDHNHLISTKGLRDVYTLLHLNCSHNHLACVAGLENNALLNTLDLRANSLTEPPSLRNQVLLRELYLDDNSISSLQGLNACWLPLMQHLSVAQNRITQLPPMSDSVSLSSLDLRFNCMSELQNVCESLEGLQFLQEVRLTGNPLQQENDWRSTLQKAVPGLRAIDDQQTDSYLSPPAGQQLRLASGSFLMFCQVQLQMTQDLEQRHRTEISNASSSLDAMKTACRHSSEVLQLATEQRFAQEYGDTTVAEKHLAAGQTSPEETLDIDSATSDNRRLEKESDRKSPAAIPNRNSTACRYWTDEDGELLADIQHQALDSKTGPTRSNANYGTAHCLETKSMNTSDEVAPGSNNQVLDLQSCTAGAPQRRRRSRQTTANISSPSREEGGGDGRTPESGPSDVNRRAAGRDYAASVIQAFWRGFSLRRRLASALATATCQDTEEDEIFEELDLNEFVVDEAALEGKWTLPLSEDYPTYYPESDQPLSLKPPGSFSESSQDSRDVLPPSLARTLRQAWVSAEPIVYPLSSNRKCSPTSGSGSTVSGHSDRSEKIMKEWGFTDSHTASLMLKRAQKMRSKKQHQNQYRDPSIHPTLYRNHSAKVEARDRKVPPNRNYIKVGEAEQVAQRAKRTERAKEERSQQPLHTRANNHSDPERESVHFLPEISADILNGGRVHLMADPGFTECLHHTSRLWANSGPAARPCTENNYPHRSAVSHGREKVPSPKQTTAAPLKKERISIREKPVQLSNGWGGGQKRKKHFK